MPTLPIRCPREQEGLRGSCSLSHHRVERQIDVDGVGAFDHVLRAAMLSKVAEVPSLRGLLPFVEAAYARPSSCVRVDEEGVRHTIEQHEGGEQGDPLIRLLFSLGIHKALEEIQQQLEPGNPSSRSWTTCTFCAHPNGLVCCTICSKQRCENERASSCSRARHARGIAQESAQLT